MRVIRIALIVIAWCSYGNAQAKRCEAPPPETPRAPEPVWTDEQREHWAFVPPVRPAIPQVDRTDWVRNPVDAFILRELERMGLSPAVEADRATLIRRVSFDLTGLPPNPEEVDAFVADERPDAYEHLVDRLLASHQYGERWARPWLDLARYAESDGFKTDATRPNAWRYRDWVIHALNADVPYDQFLRLQLAGDEISPGDYDAFVATAFNRHWPFEDNNKVPGLNRQLMLEDITDTTASVFLGLTVGCARCHDHKFDPISQKDYYRFQALFAAVTPNDAQPLCDPFDVAIHDFLTAAHQEQVADAKREIQKLERPFLAELLKDKLAKLPAEVREAFETEPEARSAPQEELLAKHAKAMTVDPKVMRSAMPREVRQLWEDRTQARKSLEAQAPADLPMATGMVASSAEAKPVHLLRKGNFAAPGELIRPGFLSVLSPSGRSVEDPLLGRRQLAEWLTAPNHPLTARVMANRLWQGHFGRGIVATPSDFGTQGNEPSHPELLDWLASEFVARGWSLKQMHRLMVTSATYRQSSTPSAESLDADPDNILFARMPRRRLEAEAVRDSLLAVSGILNFEAGGPSVFPELPPGIQTRGGWTLSKDPHDRNRRSIYVFVRRNLKYPLFDAFDAPDTNVTCPDRNVSVNAPQSLMLLNSDLVLEFARHLAGRVLQHEKGEAAVRAVYRLALGRQPTPPELARALQFLSDDQNLIAAGGPSGGGAIPTPAGVTSTESAAFVDFCHAVLNLNEFVFVD